MKIRVGLSLIIAISMTLLISPLAHASCFFDENAPPYAEQLASAHLVFVGVTTRVEADGRLAAFRVEEVWYGDLTFDEVVVRGGPIEPGVATSVDRTFAVDTRYVVVPSVGPDGYEDNSCSLTRELDAEAAAARPADFTMVEPDAGSTTGSTTGSTDTSGDQPDVATDDTGISAGWVAGAAAAVAAIGLGGVLVWKRRQTSAG